MIDLQNDKSDTWKIQLKFEITCISSKDAETQPVIHLSSDNIKFTPYNDANDKNL